jgi:PAS domain S-box-containing protein
VDTGEALNAYLEAALDAVILADASGRVLEFNAAAERMFGYAREQALGKALGDLIVPPSLRERHTRAFTRFAKAGEAQLFGRRLELTGMRADGSELPVELSLSRVHGEPLRVCGAIRDLTDAKRAEGDLHRLADEQMALRRVATLVADEAAPDVIFASVAEEIARLLVADRCAIGRFDANDSMTVVAYWSNEEPKLPIGTRIGLQGDDVTAAVRQSGRPILIDDHEAFSGPLIDYARKLGSLPRSTVAAPIFVEGRIWGSIFASTMAEEVAEGTESRVVDFAELVATAIANTEARRELERVATEQRALRTAATMVASGASPGDVFTAITTLAADLFEVPFASLLRYGSDEKATMIAGCAACSGFVGQTWTVPDDDPGIVRTVVASRRPARIEDHGDVHGPLGEAARSLGIGSVIGAPVIVDGSVWGVLAVGAALDGPPLPADAGDRLVGFTELVTTTLINAETRDSLRRLADEQAALRRVATLAARESSPDEVLEAVAKEAARVLEVDAIGMLRFEPDETATLVAQSETPWEPLPLGTAFTLDGENLVASVHRTGHAARMDDWESATGAVAAMAHVLGVRSAVACPIVVEGRLWGTMVAATNQTKPLPADTEARIVEFAELLAMAISNAESREALIRLVDEQAALRRVATLVAAGIAPDELFSAVSEEVARLFTAEGAGVGRFEPDGSGVVAVGRSESLRSIPVGSRQDLDKTLISGEVYRTGRSARIDLRRDDIDVGELGEMARQVLAMGFSSTVAAPIVVERELWGLVTAGRSRTTLPPNTEKRVESFSELVATAIANAESRAELATSEAHARGLAEEQAALRRLATLVAERTPTADLYTAVAEEVSQLLGVETVNLVRYGEGHAMTVLASLHNPPFPVGSTWPLEGESLSSSVFESRLSSRIDDYSELPGPISEATRRSPITSSVGVPIVVSGTVWGMLAVAGAEPLRDGIEDQLRDFTELVAIAVSDASTRAELVASRARIVAAGDEARRRIERNLHDGTQQRLVALGLDLQAVTASIPAAADETQAQLRKIGREIRTVLEDVRELSRGLHPGLLSQNGLQSSLKALARKSPVPVDVTVEVERRPPEAIEIAVYYVVSEALTNVAKYADASEATVTVTTSDTAIRAAIEDNGRGGAEASGGSGLTGLIDRVEALGGRFVLDSPPGRGTRIEIELPLVTADAAGVTPRLERARASEASLLAGTQLSQAVDADTLLVAITAVADALYIVDPQGRIRFTNPAALRILGYQTDSQLLGRPSHDTIHYLRPNGTPFPAADCPLLRPRVTGETVRVSDDWFVRQDGSLVPVAYSSAPLALPGGRGAVVSFRERTEDGPSPPEIHHSA